jgi:hypothetical protein
MADGQFCKIIHAQDEKLLALLPPGAGRARAFDVAALQQLMAVVS